MQILFLMIWLLAQSSESGSETSGGIPLALVLLVGLLIVSMFIRMVFRTGSQHRRRDDEDEDDDEEDDEDDNPRPRTGYGDDEDEELYLMDRDHAWDEDGYSIEDE